MQIFNYLNIQGYGYPSIQSPVNDDIIDVWDYNFIGEIDRLSQLIEIYPIISFVSIQEFIVGYRVSRFS